MSNYDETEDSQPPFGIAGFACLIFMAVIYYATEPMLSQHFVWWGKLLIYCLASIAVAFTILYRSSWHRELQKVRRILILSLSACLVFGVTMLIVGLIMAVLFFISYGPPVTGPKL